MLRAIGYRCDLHVEKGWIRPSGPMLHDPTGKAWASCSLLFASFSRGAEEPNPPGDAILLYGRQYVVNKGSIKLPPRALSTWNRIGVVSEIEYSRPGTRAPGDFGHLFGKRRWQSLFKKGGLPVLYSRGRLMRLELGRGCVVDDRGIVHP